MPSWSLKENVARLADLFEQAVALALYIYLVQRILPRSLDYVDFAQALILLSEGSALLFLFIRKPTTGISTRPADWAAAFASTIIPLLIVRGDAPFLPAIGFYVILFGLIVQIGAKLSLNRSFGLIAANRGVKTSGAYRYVRHPMYLGYMLTHLGFLLAAPRLFNIFIYAACWAILLIRIEMEERILMQDEAYQKFAEAVRYRLAPGLY
ncbi:MAG: methyltransferase [Parvularculaceae bacterium]